MRWRSTRSTCQYRERFRIEDLVVSGDLESVIAFAEAAKPAPVDLLAQLHARFDPMLPQIAPPMMPV